MENEYLYLHATNVTLAKMLGIIDPFVARGKQIEEQTAVAAGFETELEMVTR